jgi:hypothetical protein
VETWEAHPAAWVAGVAPLVVRPAAPEAWAAEAVRLVAVPLPAAHRAAVEDRPLAVEVALPVEEVLQAAHRVVHRVEAPLQAVPPEAVEVLRVAHLVEEAAPLQVAAANRTTAKVM